MQSRELAVLGFLLATTSVGAAAQTPQLNSFDEYCTVGAMRTCASVRVWTVWDPTANLTRVQLWLRNLEGTLAQENTGGAPIAGIGVIFPHLKNASNLQVTTTKNAEVVGNPDSFWSITNRQIEGPVSFSTTVPSPEGAVLGCNLFPSGVQNYFRTCGENAWVVFGFTTTNQWQAKDAQIAWKLKQNPGPTQFYLSCRTSDAPGDPEYCEPVNPTATPEPISLALMGTGLAGIAAVRRRRRKGADSVTEE